jgi:hypothetical protein
MTLDFGIAPMYNAGRALAPFFHVGGAVKKGKGKDKSDKGKGGRKC